MSFFKNRLFAIPVFNFFAAAVFGMLMRGMLIGHLPFNFKFLTHAHSHVAILGWIYMALFLLLIQSFGIEFSKSFRRLFWLTQIAVVGMIIGFPIQGYGPVSIAASSLYIIFSYVFTAMMLKKTKSRKSAAASLLRTSLLWLSLSTLSLWALGPVIANLGAASKPALLIIQYFLHFQLNGWFLFAIVALIFHFFKVPETGDFKKFHLSFALSVVFTFGLPINWYYDFEIFRTINTVGLILQAIALFYGFRIIKSNDKEKYAELDFLSKLLLIFVAVCFILKIVFQSFSVVPEIAKNIFDNRQAVLGFIHLMMLGIISSYLFFHIRLQVKNKATRRLINTGIYFFLVGILFTELLLLYQGLSFYFPELSVPNYYFWLWLVSFGLLAGIYMIWISTFNIDFKTVQNPDKE